MHKVNYITNDAWWNSDLPLFALFSKCCKFNVFSFSAKHYKKQFPIKESAHVEAIVEFERKYRLKNVLSLYAAIKALKGILVNKEKCDVDFYVFGDDFYFNILFLAFFKKKSTIISFHNYRSHSDSPVYERFFKKVFLRHFKNFHFHSKLQYDLFLAENAKANALYTDMPVKSYGAPQHKINVKDPFKRTFLFFGFIRDYKRIDLFIEAANQSQSDARFIIAGQCSNWKALEAKIADKTKFTCNIGFVDNSEVADYFTQVDFLVLPYSDTTQSGPLLIAYNYHLPVIASNLEMFQEMVTDGYNGYLFESNNAKDLQQCIDKASLLTDQEYSLLKENQKKATEAYNQRLNNVSEEFKDFIDNNIVC